MYDVTTGGLGACTALYHTGYEFLRQAKELASSCSCGYATGCPCCTLNARCSHHNQDLDRKGALRLLSMILQMGEEKQRAQAHAEASEVGGFLLASPQHTSRISSSNNSNSNSNSSSNQVNRRPGGSTAKQAAASSAGVDPSPRKERRRKALKSSLNRGTFTLSCRCVSFDNWLSFVFR